MNAIESEIFLTRVRGVVSEMQNSLFRTGYSTVIRESRDASCAITSRDGELVAQYAVLPLHLGIVEPCVHAVVKAFPLEEMADGDAYVLNDPYSGGSPHANDMAVVAPVMLAGSVAAFVVSIAHKSDIGGTVPGSCAGDAREVFHEGLQLPPVRYAVGGEVVRDVETVLAANSRSARDVIGDLRGQWGATQLGRARLVDLFAGKDSDEVDAVFLRTLRQTEEQARSVISGWPDGVYAGQTFLDHDGVELDRRLTVHVEVTIFGDRVKFDFRGTDEQSAGAANIRPPVVLAACYYVLRCLTGTRLPANGGLGRVIEAEFREGSLLSPRWPAAVNSYIGTSHAVAEAVLAALSQAVPKALVAGSGGTAGMSMGFETSDGGRLVQYELFGAGMGARGHKDGESGIAMHVGNSRITPVEIIESEFPVQVMEFALTTDSGGDGMYRGGLGFVRQYKVERPATVVFRGDKSIVPPTGLEGGGPGRCGRIVVNPGPEERILPSRFGGVRLNAGEVLRIERPGGGGIGLTEERRDDAVERDRLEGYVSGTDLIGPSQQ